jgi:hypothetical protein
MNRSLSPEPCGFLANAFRRTEIPAYWGKTANFADSAVFGQTVLKTSVVSVACKILPTQQNRELIRDNREAITPYQGGTRELSAKSIRAPTKHLVRGRHLSRRPELGPALFCFVVAGSRELYL